MSSILLSITSIETEYKLYISCRATLERTNEIQMKVAKTWIINVKKWTYTYTYKVHHYFLGLLAL